MRYLFFLLPILLSGCLNIPFVPFVHNDMAPYHLPSIDSLPDDKKIINN
jgi:hypothetical protein